MAEDEKSYETFLTFAEDQLASGASTTTTFRPSLPICEHDAEIFEVADLGVCKNVCVGRDKKKNLFVCVFQYVCDCVSVSVSVVCVCVWEDLCVTGRQMRLAPPLPQFFF